jgi:hypothetical protein
MTQQQALDIVGDNAGNAYPEHDTRNGNYYTEPRANGKVNYSFTAEEAKGKPEDSYPWDDSHIWRIWDDEENIIWQG